MLETDCLRCRLGVNHSGNNVYHRISHMFSLWLALKAHACATASSAADCRSVALPRFDLHFASPSANAWLSNSGWPALAGGQTVPSVAGLAAPSVASPRPVAAGSGVQQAGAAGSGALGCAYEHALFLSGGRFDLMWLTEWDHRLVCAAGSALWRGFVHDLRQRLGLAPHEDRARLEARQRRNRPQVRWPAAPRATRRERQS